MWKKLDFFFRTSEPSVECFEWPDSTGVLAGVDAGLLGLAVVATKGAVVAGITGAAAGIEWATALLGVVLAVELELGMVPAGPRLEVVGALEGLAGGAGASRFELCASGVATGVPDGKPLIGALLVGPVILG